MRNLILMFVVAGAVAGCGSPMSSSTTAAMNQGCRAGYADGGRGAIFTTTRNEQLYATDKTYRYDWDKGYRQCFDRAISDPNRW